MQSYLSTPEAWSAMHCCALSPGREPEQWNISRNLHYCPVAAQSRGRCHAVVPTFPQVDLRPLPEHHLPAIKLAHDSCAPMQSECMQIPAITNRPMPCTVENSDTGSCPPNKLLQAARGRKKGWGIGDCEESQSHSHHSVPPAGHPLPGPGMRVCS